ncbi:MAG: GNAT family N-acetyltransferase [Alphaproteobacteria bacterium]
MNHGSFHIKPLEKENRTDFDCGSKALNHYFGMQVSQDVKRKVAKCFIAIDKNSDQIAGFYTLCACNVRLQALPREWQKKLPKYPDVPSALIGRLAIDISYQGKKVGSGLIFDAMQRALRSEVAVHSLVVEAKDERAVSFYLHHGFQQDRENPNKLFIPFSVLTQSIV